MIPSRARAMCATSRKRIGVLALSGAEPVTRLGVWAAEGIEIAEEKFEAPESRWLDFSDQGNGAATPKNAGF